MVYKTLILGASYGSLLGTKLLMAGHDVTLVCRSATADLINAEGTLLRLRLKGEDADRTVRSRDLPGKLAAATPEDARPEGYDLVCLAMQEPQLCHRSVRGLLGRIADARVPSMSIMNMPPLPYLLRIPGLDGRPLAPAFTDARIWDRFDPALVTLCSPDPQAFRPRNESANVLQVGLPTNFKAAAFAERRHNEIIQRMAQDIDALRLDSQDVPVKLRNHASLFVPFAKWSMLAAGNYRCVTEGEPISIRDAVATDLELSAEIYGFVEGIVMRMGADPQDLVPFDRYAQAAETLGKPSSVARAVAEGAGSIERVDKLIQLVGRSFGMAHAAFDMTVDALDRKLAENRISDA